MTMWVLHFLKFLPCMQHLCTFIVALLMTSTAMQVSWPSPTIPLLTSPNSPIGTQLTKEEASWVASSKSLGMLPGAIILGLLIDKLGRKKNLFLAGALLSLSWIIIIFSVSLTMLLIARVIGGISAAFTAGIATIYIGEISQKNIRGRLITILCLGSGVASVIVLGAGPFVSFTTLALISAMVSILFCAGICCMPESPYYLVKINKHQEACDALRFLSKASDVDAWVKEIESSVQQDEASELTAKKLFLQPNYRNALIIAIAMKTLHQFSGSYAISAYLQTIMEESQTSLTAETSSIILACVQLPSVLASAYLIDKWGRRSLLVVSTAGCTIALIGEGLYFYLLHIKIDLSTVYFLPTLFLILYFIMMSIGIATLPYVISGELFASNIKKVGGSVFAFYSGLLSFASVKIFNPISEALGMYAVFWLFAAVCFIGIFFALFVLPETKGKSFEEIQAALNGKKNKLDHKLKPNDLSC